MGRVARVSTNQARVRSSGEMRNRSPGIKAKAGLALSDTNTPVPIRRERRDGLATGIAASEVAGELIIITRVSISKPRRLVRACWMMEGGTPELDSKSWR